MPIIIYVVAGCFALSAFLMALSLIPSKSEVTERLEELEGLRWDGTGTRAQAFERIFSEGQRGKLQQQLQEAGWYQISPAKMGARIVSGGGFGLAVGLTLCTYLGHWDKTFLAGIGLLAFGGAYLPLSQLKMAVQKRKSAIQRALPD